MNTNRLFDGLKRILNGFAVLRFVVFFAYALFGLVMMLWFTVRHPSAVNLLVTGFGLLCGAIAWTLVGKFQHRDRRGQVSKH
jgi:lipid-A-disaccharide synthase-like uncharacterized protein